MEQNAQAENSGAQGIGGQGAGGQGRGEQIVDARERGTMSCADMAMGAFDGLATDASFMLVADHDPRGINYMLQAERAGMCAWESLEDGPEVWRARITRTASA